MPTKKFKFLILELAKFDMFYEMSDSLETHKRGSRHERLCNALFEYMNAEQKELIANHINHDMLFRYFRKHFDAADISLQVSPRYRRDFLTDKDVIC